MVRQKSPFLESIHRYMPVHSYSNRTIQTYLHWIKYFIIYHAKRRPSKIGGKEVELFLTFLAFDQTVSPATQRVVLNALSFLYNNFLDQPPGDISAFRRSSNQQKSPVVQTRPEMGSLLSHLSGYRLLIASIIYASGLRRMETIQLRGKNIHFDHLQIPVWNEKGYKHRLTKLAP